uniref:hypothetical protein n=1 Tax=Paracoccus sp. TaxID=267 RepID=UPI0035B19E80
GCSFGPDLRQCLPISAFGGSRAARFWQEPSCHARPRMAALSAAIRPVAGPGPQLCRRQAGQSLAAVQSQAGYGCFPSRNCRMARRAKMRALYDFQICLRLLTNAYPDIHISGSPPMTWRGKSGPDLIVAGCGNDRVAIALWLIPSISGKDIRPEKTEFISLSRPLVAKTGRNSTGPTLHFYTAIDIMANRRRAWAADVHRPSMLLSMTT